MGCMKPVIGLTDPMSSSPVKNRRYGEWISRWIPEAEVVLLSVTRGNAGELDRCHGLVLSGGVDIDPRLYGFEDREGLAREIHSGRDAFEVDLVRTALGRRLPILGICRGAQLTNIVLGGTLHPDVERAGFSSHRSTRTGDSRHPVRVEEGSLLHSVAGVTSGDVNSAHHQAIDRLGAGLRVSARSPEGLIEGCEWAEPAGRPFLLLVQWHPERMDDLTNPLAQTVILRFAEALQRNNIHEEHA